MRQCRYRLYPMVPAGCGRARYPKLAAPSDRPEPWRYVRPNCARLAAAAFPGNAANSRDLLGSASRGESCLSVDPIELRRVPRTWASLVANRWLHGDHARGGANAQLCRRTLVPRCDRAARSRLDVPRAEKAAGQLRACRVDRATQHSECSQLRGSPARGTGPGRPVEGIYVATSSGGLSLSSLPS